MPLGIAIMADFQNPIEGSHHHESPEIGSRNASWSEFTLPVPTGTAYSSPEGNYAPGERPPCCLAHLGRPPAGNRPPRTGPLPRWVRRLPRESPREDSARKRAARQGLPSAAGWRQAEDARRSRVRPEIPSGSVLADARREGGTAASGCAHSAGSAGPVHPSRRLWRAAPLRAEGTPSHNLDIMQQSTISGPALDLMR
jgi:hypothetical protein